MSLIQNYAAFKTQLHEQWEQDRAARRKVPLTEAWRGSLGLAALLANVEASIEHGSVMLMDNQNVEWLCIRDVPIGHFPGSRAMHKRDVNYVTKGKATVKHGMPFIDCVSGAREAWDFKFLPFPKYVNKFGDKPWDTEVVEATGDVLHSKHYEREFGVLNMVSAAMTRVAFAGLDHGKPVRPAWTKFRPADIKVERLTPLASVFPVPYVGFDIKHLPKLYWACSESEAGGSVHDCPSCDRSIESLQFNQPKARVEFLEDGNFVANCPRCGKRRKWFLNDQRPVRVKRRFGLPFRIGFCQAVAKGLPVVGTETCTYGGTLSAQDGSTHDREHPGLDLVGHRLLKAAGGSTVVYLPRVAKIMVTKGDTIDAGLVWAQALPVIPRDRWRQQPDVAQWASLHEVCGGPEWVGYLQQLWFNNQAIVSDQVPGQVIFPADLVVTAARQLGTTGLWWDLTPCDTLLDAEKEAIVFPPVRLRHWNRLTLPLPFETVLDARIVDPRFSEGRRPQVPQPQRRPDNRNLKPRAKPVMPRKELSPETVAAVDALWQGCDALSEIRKARVARDAAVELANQQAEPIGVLMEVDHGYGFEAQPGPDDLM